MQERVLGLYGHSEVPKCTIILSHSEKLDSFNLLPVFREVGSMKLFHEIGKWQGQEMIAVSRYPVLNMIVMQASKDFMDFFIAFNVLALKKAKTGIFILAHDLCIEISSRQHWDLQWIILFNSGKVGMIGHGSFWQEGIIRQGR